MQRLLRTLWAESGTTILFVTHNLNEAIYLGTRVVVLGPGQGILTDFRVPSGCRAEDGYPRREELEKMVRQVEEAGEPQLAESLA
jgi:ABC-type nitrate/sulfonate/bicarbonate transport system ATPase subunit